MSMASYVGAHCRAAAYDPSYDAREFWGGGEDDVYDISVPASTAVAEMVAGAASAIGNDVALSSLYLSSRSSEVDQADVPAAWQSGLNGLDEVERRVLSNALSVPVHNLGIATVGIVRRLPDTELVKAKGIGTNRAAILKALGHNADQETKLIFVVGGDRIADGLKAEAVEEYGSWQRARMFL